MTKYFLNRKTITEKKMLNSDKIIPCYLLIIIIKYCEIAMIQNEIYLCNIM
eukprot:GAHX01004147.1.p2 GENE.GAHX01004147.1~~GAHX01004147.1.p2  ORF type:complete len:51 (-),score=1.55 GAHX01004147.1:150-302(-)